MSTTKTQVADFLKKSLGNVAKVNVDLAERVNYALKRIGKTDKITLEELADEVKVALGNGVTAETVVPTNEVIEVQTTADEDKDIIPDEDLGDIDFDEDFDDTAADTSEPEKEQVETTPKIVNVKKPKITNKKTDKKEVKKPSNFKAENNVKKPVKKEESPIKTVKTTGDLNAPMATLFPKVIKHEVNETEIALVKAGSDLFRTVQNVADYLQNVGEVYFACYWSKRHIKQYNYEFNYRVEAPKNGFPNDLDITRLVADAPRAKRLWCMSDFTEAMYFFEEEDLEPITDKNPYNGEEYTVRVSNGMEFEIYIDANDTARASNFFAGKTTKKTEEEPETDEDTEE